MNSAASKPTPPGPTSAALPPLLPVLVAGLLFSGLIVYLDLDLRIARWAYGGAGSWRYETSIWVLVLYQLGTWPCFMAGVLGAVVWLLSRFAKVLQPYARLAGFCALLLALGPGLTVNALLKQHFGRPRPSQITEFGGTHAYSPVWQPTSFRHGHSFPSGHASMGFYWVGLFVFYYSQNRRLARGLLALGLVHGGVMGFARILQGSHWFSDVLWSALLDYLAAWVLYCGPRLLAARWHGRDTPTHDPSAA